MRKYRLVVVEEKEDSVENILYEDNVTGRTFMEVKLNAENLLKKNFLANNLKPNNKIKIRLVSMKNPKKIYEMIWYDINSTKNIGYFKGWKFKEVKKEKENKWHTFKDTSLAPIAFSIGLSIIVLLISLAKNTFGIFTENNKEDFISILSFLIFIGGFIYSGASPLFRANFNQMVNTIKGVVAFNILLEVPIWIAAIATIYNLNNNGLFKIIKFEWAIFVVIIYAVCKVVISSILDIEKLSIKKENIL